MAHCCQSGSTPGNWRRDRFMRTYKRDQDDKATSIARCYFDAEQGRIELALERIADLFDEFPGDGDVHYLHGLLLRDYLGRGLEARDAFEAAFENSESTSDIPGLAACNITSLSRDQQEFDCWAETAVQLMPE